jgi:hypothetical protein
MDPDTKRFLQTQMIWVAISLAISLALSFLLPFPLSLVTIIGVFLAMNYYMRRWQMRRMGMTGSSTGGGGFGSLFGGSGGGGVNYVCIVCGQRFKGGTCPLEKVITLTSECGWIMAFPSSFLQKSGGRVRIGAPLLDDTPIKALVTFSPLQKR